MNMNKNMVIRNLVNLSSSADKKGQIKLASKLIVCAKSIQEEKPVEEIDSLFSEINASNGDLLKEAGISDWWAGVKGGMQGAWQGAKNIGHQFADPMKTQAAFNRAMKFMQNVDQNVKGLLEAVGAAYNFVQPYGNNVMTNALAQIYQNVQGFQNNSKQIQSKLSEIDMNLKQTTVRGDGGDPLAAQQGQPQAGGQGGGQGGGQPDESQGEAMDQFMGGSSAGQTISEPVDRFQGLSDEDLQAEIKRRQQAKQQQAPAPQAPAPQAGGVPQTQQPQRAKKPANPASRRPRTNKPDMQPFDMQGQIGAIGNTFNKFLKTSKQ